MRRGTNESSLTLFGRTRRQSRRLPILLLLIPLLSGLFAAPAAAPVAGDELSDAVARQKALERQIAANKARVADLTKVQSELSGQIAATSRALRGINADLTEVRTQVNAMVKQVNSVRAKYEGLVAQLAELDAQLKQVETEETAKRAELGERRQLLAERLRIAYDTDRKSLLETFLSGASFSDVLEEVSYELDIGEQDRALAEQIIKDQQTLAALHQTVEMTRTETDGVRKETAAKKRDLDKQLAELKAAQAALKELERKTATTLAQQKKAYAQLAKNKAAAQRAMAQAAAAQRALAAKIEKLVQEQYNRGNIPSQYNGTLRWPMIGQISTEYGCVSFSWYAPGNGCTHYHNGIDIVAPKGTPIRAAGAGRVVYVGWNRADGPDPAWIVIIAHSTNLQTWYGHMQPIAPVHAGQAVSAGTVIGYEGETGRATGPHLHWMVAFNGQYNFVNPRLFL